MTQSIDGALEAIAGVVASVSGVGASPAFLEFNINEKVFANNYIMTGSAEISETGTKQWLLTIASDLITPLVNVANEDIQFILQLTESISTALITETTSGGDMFGGAIDTFNILRLEFLPGNYFYNGVPHIGYRLMLEDVKLKINL